MAIPAQYQSRYIYQFTHLSNLPKILEHGLLSYNEKERLGISHHSIAEESIQERRAEMAVTCGPCGVMHDYVPFYFCARTSMLLSVVRAKNVDQLYLIYLAVSIGVLDRPNVVFTSASANTSCPPDFFENPSDLNRLDWANIDSMKWSMPSDKAKQSRMAEALIQEQLAIDQIDHIIVWSKAIKQQVETIYREAGVEPPQNCFRWLQ